MSPYSQSLRSLTLLLLLPLLAACGHVLSPAVRASATPELTIATLKTAPDTHQGETLLTAAAILHNLPAPQGSELELFAWKSGWGDEPLYPDEAGGRFLAVADRFLDPALYQPGQLVTIAATAVGSENRTVEGVGYTYPLLRIVEIYVWPGPLRYQTRPAPIYGPVYPAYDPAWYRRENPYDPGYNPFPYSPQDALPH